MADVRGTTIIHDARGRHIGPFSSWDEAYAWGLTNSETIGVGWGMRTLITPATVIKNADHWNLLVEKVT